MINEWSQIGSYHKERNIENQDVVCSGENKRFQVIALADGVSTCENAREGAQIACRAAVEFQLQKGKYLFDFSTEKTANFILSHILHELQEKAGSEAKAIDGYSSTIASVLLDKKTGKVMFFSIGDSLIMAAQKEKCKVVAKPSDSTEGCCVTTTRNALQMAQIGIMDAAEAESIMICSDGAWRQMYERNRLKREVKELLTENEYASLGKYLDANNGYDDYSFISMNLGRTAGGK